CQQYNDMMFTF
nr:immunoglobulin light chain junction region [Macaca mulatta]MOX57704.1 immunoglobulin light chain junction region [Macaca mulatta]